MREITGNFPMKFIGRPEGKLMKGAPGNYIHGQTYNVPYYWSEWAFWELIGEKPTVKVPESTEGDDVYEAYLPPSDDEPTPPPTPVIVKPAPPMPGLTTEDGYQKHLQKLDRGDYTVDKDGIIHYEEDPAPEPDREELKKILNKAGVEYNPRTRTPNLLKLVEELDEAKK